MPSEWFKNLMRYRNLGYSPKEAASLASGRRNRAISRKGIAILVILLAVIGGSVAIALIAGPSLSEMMQDVFPSAPGIDEPPEPDATIGAPPAPAPAPEPTPPAPVEINYNIAMPIIKKITQTSYWDETSTTLATLRVDYIVNDPMMDSSSKINVYISETNNLVDPVAIAPSKSVNIAGYSGYVDLAISYMSGVIMPVYIYLTLEIGGREGCLSQPILFEIVKTSTSGINTVLSITSTTMGIHLLSWTDALCEYYKIYRSSDLFTSQIDATVIATTTNENYIDQLTSNGIFYYAVLPIVANGKEGILSNVVAMTVDIPNLPDPAVDSFVKRDESADFKPFASISYGGVTGSYPPEYTYQAYENGPEIHLYYSLVDENGLKLLFNVPSLYNSQGEPAVLYGTSISGNGYRFLVKIDTRWWLSFESVVSLDELSHALKDLESTTNGGFKIPGGISEPRSYLLGVYNPRYNLEVLFAFFLLLFFFMFWK